MATRKKLCVGTGLSRRRRYMQKQSRKILALPKNMIQSHTRAGVVDKRRFRRLAVQSTVCIGDQNGKTQRSSLTAKRGRMQFLCLARGYCRTSDLIRVRRIRREAMWIHTLDPKSRAKKPCCHQCG